MIRLWRIWRRSQVVRRRSAKPLFTGSIPVAASERTELYLILNIKFARVAEQADARDLKSLGEQSLYRFNSGLGHKKAVQRTSYGVRR